MSRIFLLPPRHGTVGGEKGLEKFFSYFKREGVQPLFCTAEQLMTRWMGNIFSSPTDRLDDWKKERVAAVCPIFFFQSREP